MHVRYYLILEKRISKISEKIGKIFLSLENQQKLRIYVHIGRLDD